MLLPGQQTVLASRRSTVAETKSVCEGVAATGREGGGGEKGGGAWSKKRRRWNLKCKKLDECRDCGSTTMVPIKCESAAALN